MISLIKISKYYYTLKYLKIQQTFGRLYGEFKRRYHLFRVNKLAELANYKLNPKVEFINHDPWNSIEDLKNGKFCFLNISKSLGYPSVNWGYSNCSTLWEYNLHYFNYLFLFNREDQEKLCEDWIVHNADLNSNAWHPYVTSLRIVNWCKSNFTSTIVQKNLYRQASYLFKNTEFFHPGNHYLENARALIFAGRYFQFQGESKKWFRKGIKILKQEIKNQILGDGGYFERSPMYHALMLELFLDIYNILPKHYNETVGLDKLLPPMLNYLRTVTHPDGSIALLNDSTTEIAPNTSALLRYYSTLLTPPETVSQVYPETGHFTYRDDNVYLLIDGGKIGPDHLPAHAHADIFSYELSLFDRKFVVDTGTPTYKSGLLRRYIRSTLAHNTLMVDNTDQAECWSSFRVGRRYNPLNVKFEKNEYGFNFSGEFHGYDKLIGDGIIHTRLINYDFQEKVIFFKDIISGNNNHKVQSIVHFDPSVKITNVSKNEISFRHKEQSVLMKIISGHFSIVDTFYSPEFNTQLVNIAINIEYSGDLPTELSYSLTIDC